MGSGRKQRTHYDFGLGEQLQGLDHSSLLRQASVQLDLALVALEQRDRWQARARLQAAREAVDEARRRGEQLLLRM